MIAPPNGPTANTVSFPERSLTETYYYSATDSPSVRISTPITEAIAEPSTTDTHPEASKYVDNTDDFKHIVLDKEEGRKEGLKE